MEPIKFLCLLLTLWCVQVTNGFTPEHRRLTFSENHARFLERAAARSDVRHPKGSESKAARVFYPISYGADPTGAEDSSDAMLKAVGDAFNVQHGKELLPGINDLGGVIIDLQGGDYSISKPIRFPPAGGGDVVIQGGTLRASSNFPKDEYLIELWSDSSQRQPRTAGGEKAGSLGVYYEDITFRDILFDAGFRGGGLLVIDSVRIRVDNCFFIHFETRGILVERGHETFISSCFLGQHLSIGGDPGERNFSGTAVELAGNDNAITDVAIFSAATGIVLRGQANVVTGVHCYNKATYWGGVGILVKLAGLGQTRIDNCYMDYTGIVLEDPVQVHVTDAFFLGDANIVLKSVEGKISGLTVVDNMFAGSGQTPIVELDESEGPRFSVVDQVVIDHNNVNGQMKLKATVGRLTAAGNGTRWAADFSSLLVFPDRISHVQCSLYVRGNGRRIPAHAVTGVANNTVVVEAEEAVDGVVSVAVDQYSMPGEQNLLM